MQKTVKLLGLDKAQGDTLRAYLIKGTTGVFILHAVSTGLGFITNVLLARFLGSVEYGVYTYVFAWVGLLTVLSMFGFGNVLIREIAAYQVQKQWELVCGILRWVGGFAFLFSLGVAAVAAILIYTFRHLLNAQIFPAIWVALLLLPILTLFNLNNQALIGNKKVIEAQLTGVLARAPLFIVLLIVVLGTFPSARTATMAIFLSLYALFVALLAGLGLLYRTLPRQVINANSEYRGKRWLKSALPMLFIAGLYELNSRVPILMLGSISGPEEAGFYSIAVLITGFIAFILMAVNLTVSPVFSNLYISGEMQRLQKIITRTTRVMMVVSLIVALLIVILREWLLLFFGSAFQRASLLLILLSIGQIVNVFAGSVGTLLVMTGYEKKAIQAVGLSTLTIAILNFFLIPRWGIDGAGLATIIGMLIWNFILIFQTYNHLGIDSTPLGKFSKWN
jgi:O-antigen/teichoic acid export membrane protein